MSKFLLPFMGMIIVYLIWTRCYPQIDADNVGHLEQRKLLGPSQYRRNVRWQREFREFLKRIDWIRVVVPSLIAILLAIGISYVCC